VVCIRGTTTDQIGNVAVVKELLRLETMAMAAHNTGGIGICQMEWVAQVASLDACQIQIPGTLAHYVVVAEPDMHVQTFTSHYNSARSGKIRVRVELLRPLKLEERNVIDGARLWNSRRNRSLILGSACHR
jgi:propionate CoA-transferase